MASSCCVVFMSLLYIFFCPYHTLYHRNVSFWALIDTFSSIYSPLPSIHVSSRLFHAELTERESKISKLSL